MEVVTDSLWNVPNNEEIPDDQDPPLEPADLERFVAQILTEISQGSH
jgi:hypothetical protein